MPSEVVAKMSKSVHRIVGISGIASSLAADRTYVVGVPEAEVTHVIYHHAERETEAQIEPAIFPHIAPAGEVASTTFGSQSGDKLETVFDENRVENHTTFAKNFFRIEHADSGRSDAKTVFGTPRHRDRAHGTCESFGEKQC